LEAVRVSGFEALLVFLMLVASIAYAVASASYRRRAARENRDLTGDEKRKLAVIGEPSMGAGCTIVVAIFLLAMWLFVQFLSGL
jgi:hypothetical protein